MNRRELLLLLGCAVVAPHAPCAQQKVMPVIGFLSGASPVPTAPYVAAFFQGLRVPAGSRDRMWQSNTAGRRTTAIGCPNRPPIWSRARSM
jgi:hypothetical protein